MLIQTLTKLKEEETENPKLKRKIEKLELKNKLRLQKEQKQDWYKGLVPENRN